MSKRHAIRRPVIGLASAFALAGCISPVAGSGGNYAKPIGNAPVTANPTPYSEGLVCLARFAQANSLPRPRVAVGRILDYTGKVDFEGGRRITQGASLMAISAFAKAGARQVERFDTSVSELELKYANNRLIGEDDDAEFRKILAGSIPGSDYYLVGGVTELNYNIRSAGVDLFAGATGAGDPAGVFNGRLFVINVGVDLRLVQTQSLEVVDVISYQKQIIGREISAGYFDFFGGSVLFDIGAGERAQEPIQLAVRAVIERAILEMSANLYGAPSPDVCGEVDQSIAQTAGITGDFEAAAEIVETTNGDTRADPERWHKRRDDAVRAALRGRQS